MQEIETIYASDGLKRVIFYVNKDGSFGFMEEQFVEDHPIKPCWALARWPDSRCDSLETAHLEASTRLGWITDCKPRDCR